ncbi:hypothetical protein NGA_0730600 [Nannochloropsis gaditana CCMP526]|uniref:uncharacterized protein n=1 Tax=Nannochloropsis gaditana (strain CCMP526) TaxID=1093141 RepID=UPI00029F5B39|nr:hypothetical protein NGA_0730600 [Nannochloropsis gaditana CCMP526]EKU23214.1 hypothetical protein NGA_0730600 [Nannochloropsis gaditana CCMP526]|eukprot:XP_005852619.1 hypothetical protein NGA_0730600 [Nannochloropsis gaditana CCMP526]
MQPSTPREPHRLSASWIIIDGEGEEVTLDRRNQHNGLSLREEDGGDGTFTVLTLHPDGGALRSEDERRDGPLLDSSLNLNDGRMIELPTMLEEEGADGMYPSDGARREASPRRDTPRQGGREQEEEEEEEEEQQQQQQQQEEARVSPRASSRAEGPSQPPTDERSENGGDGWRKRATSVVMAHFRAILKSFSHRASYCGTGAGYSIEDKLRMACPYLRRQSRQRLLLITTTIPWV